MKRDAKSFFFSLFLHLGVLGVISFCAGIPSAKDEPVLVDFSIEKGRDGTQNLSSSSPAPLAEKRHAPSREKIPSLRPPDKPVVSSIPVEKSAEAAPLPENTTLSESAPASVEAHYTAPDMGSSDGRASGGVTGGRGNDPDGKGTGDKGGGESAESLRMRYLKEHFAYIRDLVAGNLRYPPLARKMGWSGRLAVEFIVRKDGSADSVRIIRSSGVPVLDRDAGDTVLRSAPFPKPPVSAKLVIPVEYLLE